ncbi:MAG: thioredoxin domain-containing protein [Patescibacteria group bacterium]|nr:thioredoxin domain-containing protein [Patescibacteria group bacterium]MDE1944336.1 thioredoxin domain-containing protein [Patescibacteria group bacterium]MDE1944680.1 thioredoxin domain-containing protein [Patescibacteria group bacterium]MDE2057366.1 thioredoxin domain-containing protein [Patescibacteria group bacterium]
MHAVRGWMLFVTAFLFAVVAACIVLTLSFGWIGRSSASIAATLPPQLVVTGTDHSRGSAAAPVTLIEYADTECEFCKRLEPVLDTLYTWYGPTGQVRFVYRYFPLGLWSDSTPEAEALECAARAGGDTAFFAYLDALFTATASNNGLDLARLPSLASSVGLNAGAFAKCQASAGELSPAIERDVASGKALGVSQAPALFIVAAGGHVTRIVGSRSLPVLDSVIKAALAPAP